MANQSKTSFKPLANPIDAPKGDAYLGAVNDKRQIMDIHRLLLAVAELQSRVIELEQEIGKLRAAVNYEPGERQATTGGYLDSDGNPGI